MIFFLLLIIYRSLSFSLFSVGVDVRIIAADVTGTVISSHNNARTWGYQFILCLFNLCLQSRALESLWKTSASILGNTTKCSMELTLIFLHCATEENKANLTQCQTV